jgi:hypothetical protein
MILTTISAVAPGITCAVEVFIATALLHKEHPERRDFTIQEIVNRVSEENLSGELRQGVSVHASQHCCANKRPNPADHRMLFATGRSTRRLLLPGDDADPGRRGKIFPEVGEVPQGYRGLLEWAKGRYESGVGGADTRVGSPSGIGPSLTQESEAAGRWLESLFELEGLGKEYWKDVDPDEFVRKLREGWE